MEKGDGEDGVSEGEEVDRGDEAPSGGWGASLKSLAAVGGLGIEMAGMVVAGAFIGEKVGEALGLVTWMTVAGVLLGVMAFAWHVRYLLRRMKRDKGAKERGDGAV